MYTLLKQRHLRWLGHLVRMADGRIPKDLLYRELVQGKHPRGRPQLRYKDICKWDLKTLFSRMRQRDSPETSKTRELDRGQIEFVFSVEGTVTLELAFSTTLDSVQRPLFRAHYHSLSRLKDAYYSRIKAKVIFLWLIHKGQGNYLFHSILTELSSHLVLSNEHL